MIIIIGTIIYIFIVSRDITFGMNLNSDAVVGGVGSSGGRGDDVAAAPHYGSCTKERAWGSDHCPVCNSFSYLTPEFFGELFKRCSRNAWESSATV